MKRPCFTLVEVLVIMAVIVLLLTIATPVLQSSRRHTNTALCSLNISHLTTGLLAYETQNDNFPYGFDDTPVAPPPGGYAGYGQFDRKGWWWFNFIEGLYTKQSGKKTILACPSKQLRNSKLKIDILCGNYGINQSICKSSSGRKSRAEFIGLPLALSDVPHPEKTLLLVDSGYSLINWWHAAKTPPVSLRNTVMEDTAYIPGLWINKDRELLPDQEHDAINGRHPDKTVNIGFVDGHISRVKADQLLVEKTINPYTSPGPLWLPE
jgi:prepilin-type processing-associated H-X9-DG protein